MKTVREEDSFDEEHPGDIIEVVEEVCRINSPEYLSVYVKCGNIEKLVKMEVETGSSVTIISHKLFRLLFGEAPVMMQQLIVNC